MKYVMIMLCLAVPYIGFSQEYPLVDVLNNMETRFKTKLIYSNEILFLRNGAKITVTFDGSKEKKEDLIELLGKTAGLTFIADTKPNVHVKMPKRYIIKGRATRMEERIQGLHYEIRSLNSQIKSMNDSVSRNADLLESVKKELEAAKAAKMASNEKED